MTDYQKSQNRWEVACSQLKTAFPAFVQDDPSGPLTLPLADEEWLLEVTPDGQLSCQAGYDLDDMKSLLSDGTAEDLGSDELAKQAKFYLKQATSKYRRRLQEEGFAERVEMNEEYVAVFFEQSLNLQDLESLRTRIEHIQRLFQTTK